MKKQPLTVSNMSGMGNWELQATDVDGKSKVCVIEAAKGINVMLHHLPDNRNLEQAWGLSKRQQGKSPPAGQKRPQPSVPSSAFFFILRWFLSWKSTNVRSPSTATMFTFSLPSWHWEGSISAGCEEEGWLISSGSGFQTTDSD